MCVASERDMSWNQIATPWVRGYDSAGGKSILFRLKSIERQGKRGLGRGWIYTLPTRACAQRRLKPAVDGVPPDRLSRLSRPMPD